MPRENNLTEYENAQFCFWICEFQKSYFKTNLMFEINRKFVSGEDRKLLFSVFKREFNIVWMLLGSHAWTWWRFIQLSAQELDFHLTPTSEKTTIT